jgi:uncharacterized protein (TIGR02118 family)
MSKPVKLIALLKKKPGQTQAQFRERWVKGHAPFTLKMKRLRGYRINVCIEEYQQLEGELPFDGTAELWWDSLEDMQADFAAPESAVGGRDADSFTVARVHLVTEEFILR